MKNTYFVAAALFLASASSAQTTTGTGTLAPAATPATPFTSTTAVDAETLKGLTTETLRPEHSFPVLGSYKATGTSAGDVTVTLDEANKGIVWIGGLPQGRFKALMKKAPATYKIPAQQTESGKPVAEGTLFFNPESKELTIVSGRPFDDADPTSFLISDAKAQTKAWKYTGIKTGVAATVAPQASHQ